MRPFKLNAPAVYIQCIVLCRIRFAGVSASTGALGVHGRGVACLIMSLTDHSYTKTVGCRDHYPEKKNIAFSATSYTHVSFVLCQYGALRWEEVSTQRRLNMNK